MLNVIADDLAFELDGQTTKDVVREIVGRLRAYGMSPYAIEDALTGRDVEASAQ
jgi:hypothetical protein